MIYPNLRKQAQGSQAAACAYASEVEQKQTASPVLDRLMRNLDRFIGLPGAGRGDAWPAVHEIEAQDRAVRADFGEDFGQSVGAIERLEASHDGTGFRIEIEQPAGRLEVAQTGINHQVEAARDEILIEPDSRRVAGDGIKIGEIKCVQPQGFAERTGEVQGIGSRVQDASNRLIMITVAGQGGDGAAVLEVEHGNDFEGMVCHGGWGGSHCSGS